MHNTILYCNEGTSNKEYRITVENLGGVPSLFAVHCFNRRVGNPWVDQGTKVRGVEAWEAQAEVGKIIKSKLKKGYQITESDTNFQ